MFSANVYSREARIEKLSNCEVNIWPASSGEDANAIGYSTLPGEPSRLFKKSRNHSGKGISKYGMVV